MEKGTKNLIKFANGFDYKAPLGQYWIVSANLLSWELPNIKGSGKILDHNNKNNTEIFTNLENNNLSAVESLLFNSAVSTLAQLWFHNESDTKMLLLDMETLILESSTKLEFGHFSSDFDSRAQIGQFSSGSSILSILKPIMSKCTVDKFTHVVKPISGYSYLYPLALNYYWPNPINGSELPLSIDVLRGYGIYDPKSILWTRQNATADGTILGSGRLSKYEIKTVQDLEEIYYD